ncbi:MAG: PQQ-binding-like beta-propeller repeat protein [bacterium]|nr:PQQ-binding-like beta-propeller repeat protein [bacterium]
MKSGPVPLRAALAMTLILAALLPGVPAQNPGAQDPAATGWLSWRGPDQNGRSHETGLPAAADVAAAKIAWRYDLSGRGTPVIANGRVYTLGYEGEGKELEEVLLCLDERTGTRIWERRFQHFLTDIIYYRFAIGSPTIDPETGNVFCVTSSGLFCSFTPNGELRWQHATMSEFGRLVFPNGRTGSPVIDDDLAIIHMTSSGWGAHGPARERFFAFDKDTGECVWSSTPGGPPKDISYSMPALAWEDGRRVLYAGGSGGHLFAVDARTGEVLWRYQMCTGGMSSSPVVYGDKVIAIHGKENLDDSTAGRMIAVRRGSKPKPGDKMLRLDRAAELWRNDLVAFTSSPVLVDNRAYQTVATGELVCIDADTGKKLWHQKLAPDQIHASPAYGDGRLWVPMNNGKFFVIEPSDAGVDITAELQLEGNCLGAPAICNGRVYVHTTTALYCFAGPGGATAPKKAEPEVLDVGDATDLMVIPADIVIRQGDSVQFRGRSVDQLGRTVDDLAGSDVTWSGKLTPGVTIDASGKLTVARDATPMAGFLKGSMNGLSGQARLRIVADAPYSENFDDYRLAPHPKETGAMFAKPPQHWIGANLKWEVREVDGSKVLARTLDRPLFQRTITMIGHPDMANYTVQADVRTDGNRRIKSNPGIINQRYLAVLKGNHQKLEITSNEELLKESVRFRWQPKTWYTLKSRVDVNPDGSGVVRAKAWQRDQPEPEAWTLEVQVPRVNRHGSPGVYGFTPQSRFRVYLDNISVTPNE